MRFLSRLLQRTTTAPEHPAVRVECSTAPIIHLSSSHGDVEVYTHNQLEILVTYDDEPQLPALATSGRGWSFDADTQTFVLTQSQLESAVLRHSDLTLFVPAQTTLYLQSAGGDIRLAGEYAEIQIQSAGGDIETVDATAPLVRIETAGGDIDTVVTGSGTIHSSGGDVDVAILSQSTVTIATAGGDIDVDIHAPCTVNATTHAGDIDVQIDKGHETDVDASTTVGDINSDIVFHADGAGDTPIAVTLMLRTHAGDISIRQG